MIAVANAIKPDACEAVGCLKALGITPIRLTGDAEPTACVVASEVGIGEVRGCALPGRKADRPRELQHGGVRVVYVGNGSNDAPALMQAHVEIAVGPSPELAIEASEGIVGGRRAPRARSRASAGTTQGDVF